MHFSESRTSLNLAKPKLWWVGSASESVKLWGKWKDIPFASTSSSVDDGLGLLNLTEAEAELQEQVVISGGVQTADVAVLVALDAVLQALVETLALLRSGEDGRDSSGDGGIELHQNTEIGLSNTLALGRDLTDHTGDSKLLGGGGRVARAITRQDAGLVDVTAHGAKEGGARSGLSGGSRVRSTAILQAGQLTLEATVATIGGSATRGVGKNVGAKGSGNIRLHVGVASQTTSEVGIGRQHHAGVNGVAAVGGKADRNVGAHVAGGRHGHVSTLVNVTRSYRHAAELTDEATQAIVLGRGVVQGSTIMTATLGTVGSSRSHVLSILTGVTGLVAGHGVGV